MYLCMYVWMDVCMYVCMYVCMLAFVCLLLCSVWRHEMTLICIKIIKIAPQNIVLIRSDDPRFDVSSPTEDECDGSGHSPAATLEEKMLYNERFAYMYEEKRKQLQHQERFAYMYSEKQTFVRLPATVGIDDMA